MGVNKFQMYFRDSADFELSDTSQEPAVVAEARNAFISQEPAAHGHYHDDDEFSDTDSFDSSDDEELIALSNSRPDSDSSIKSAYGIRTECILDSVIRFSISFVDASATS